MDISRKSILKESKYLVSKEGHRTLSIRKLAKNLGVAIETSTSTYHQNMTSL